MTPQSQFLVLAPIADGREPALRALLDAMNAEPGLADPMNRVLPFGAFDGLHFARLVILVDPSLADIQAYGVQRAAPPLCLAFLGDCDGPAPALLGAMAGRAGDGLRSIFSHCRDFDAGADLLRWMLDRNRSASATYVNWIGRTVRQIREDSALQQALAAAVDRTALHDLAEAPARRLRLLQHVDAEVAAGRLRLTPEPPTPLAWQLANLLHAVGLALFAVLALPLIVVAALPGLLLLRRRETTDPEICPRPDPAALRELQRLEDRDVSNQYTAIGSLKPGRFRRGLLTVLLLAVDYACRHLFNKGYLARVQTIHFARWVFLDGKTRILFVSNYDGGHQAYMDDFINKVAWGLNLLFSNGVGWPHTDWLIGRGARREQPFKAYQRRHQIPTQVWYKAYPGLALTDLLRNQRIRAGLQRSRMSDREAAQWLSLL